MGTTAAPRDSWLQEHSNEWTEAGLISADQADAIRRFERAASEPATRLTVVAEVSGYLAAVIALGGGAAVVAPSWSDIGLAGRLAVALAIAVVAFVAGRHLVGLGERGASRLGGFSWAIAAGALGLATGALVDDLRPADGAWTAIAVGAVVGAAGFWLWRNLDRPLQLATAAVGAAVMGGGWFELLDIRVWVAAVTTWFVAALFGGAAAAGWLHPRTTALAIGSVGMMIGAFQLAERWERAAAIAAVASAAIIVTVAMIERSWPLVGLGLVGFVLATTMLMSAVLDGTWVRLATIAIGLVVVAQVAARAQRRADPS